MRYHELLLESRQYNGNAALLTYFQVRPLSTDLVYSDGWLAEPWQYYAETELHNADAQYNDLDATGCRAFADWLEAHGYGRQMIYDDPQQAPAWMLMEPVSSRLLPASTWLAHFCKDAGRIRREGFRYGVEDVDRIALTRENDAFGNTKRIRSTEPGYNFAYPTDGSVQLTNRWDPNGYGKQLLLFQSAGLLLYHTGDRERQVAFWGPTARLKNAHVIKALARGFIADNGMKARSIDELVKQLKSAPNRPAQAAEPNTVATAAADTDAAVSEQFRY